MSAEAMRKVKELDQLVKLVARAFCSDEEIIVLDALSRNKQYIRDEDLAAQLHLHVKQVRKVLRSLEDARLVKNESRFDPKAYEKGAEETRRQTQFLFWYIDYKRFVDVVKWRVHAIHQKLDVQREEGYSCPNCKTKYSAFEMDKLINPRSQRVECPNFPCRGTELQESIDNAVVSKTLAQKKSWQEQIRPIKELLKSTEGVELPYFDRNPLLNFVFEQPATPAGRGAPSTPATPAGAAAAEAAAAAQRGDKTNATGKKTRDAFGFMIEPSVVVDLVAPDESLAASLRTTSQTTKPVEEEKKAGKAPVPWMTSQADLQGERTADQKAKRIKVEEGVAPGDEFARKYLQELERQQDFVAFHPPPAEAVEGEANGEQVEDVEMVDGMDDPLVSVGERQVPLSQVTEEDQEVMTPEEYQAFYEVQEAVMQKMQEAHRTQLQF